ncbi:MAG TPA: hypothetical protein VF016_10425 [Nitrososphaera sp.]|jgi:hypothetical protein|nr:hypothetical protein [uncultured Nitrososphaera sp.]
MRPPQKPQKQPQSKSSRKDYDYNKPIGKCVVCYTLSGWHCYECGNDFCQTHYYEHKDRNQCKAV